MLFMFKLKSEKRNHLFFFCFCRTIHSPSSSTLEVDIWYEGSVFIKILLLAVLASALPNMLMGTCGNSDDLVIDVQCLLHSYLSIQMRRNRPTLLKKKENNEEEEKSAFSQQKFGKLIKEPVRFLYNLIHLLCMQQFHSISHNAN